MGKSNALEVYSFALGPYLYPFTISVAIIMITNRKTPYRNNGENITINDTIVISHKA